LASISLAAPVEQLELQLETVPVHPRQLGLLFQAPRRDLDAAGRAIARVKAAFGADAVTRARLCAAYLPEAAFRWEPLGEVRAPSLARPENEQPLVRRVFTQRIPMTAPGWSRQTGVSGKRMGDVQRVYGPFRVAGGWWKRRVERDYYFVETPEEQILWLYYDRPRNLWVLHGTVE
jgi:protein ImuB